MSAPEAVDMSTVVSGATTMNGTPAPRAGAARSRGPARPAFRSKTCRAGSIGRATRLLSLWAQEGKDHAANEPKHPRVHVPPLVTADLFDDVFMPVARDGAKLVEVQLRIQKSLLALSRMGDDAFKSAARQQSNLALEHAEAVMVLEAEKTRLRDLIDEGWKTKAQTS